MFWYTHCMFLFNKQLDMISVKSKQSNDTIKLIYLIPNKVMTFKIPKMFVILELKLMKILSKLMKQKKFLNPAKTFQKTVYKVCYKSKSST